MQNKTLLRQGGVGTLLKTQKVPNRPLSRTEKMIAKSREYNEAKKNAAKKKRQEEKDKDIKKMIAGGRNTFSQMYGNDDTLETASIASSMKTQVSEVHSDQSSLNPEPPGFSYDKAYEKDDQEDQPRIESLLKPIDNQETETETSNDPPLEVENILPLSPTPAAVPRSSNDIQSPNLKSPGISPVKSLPQRSTQPDPAPAPAASMEEENIRPLSSTPTAGSTGSTEESAAAVQVRKTLYLLDTHCNEPSRILNLSSNLVLTRQPAPGQVMRRSPNLQVQLL